MLPLDSSRISSLPKTLVIVLLILHRTTTPVHSLFWGDGGDDATDDEPAQAQCAFRTCTVDSDALRCENGGCFTIPDQLGDRIRAINLADNLLVNINRVRYPSLVTLDLSGNQIDTIEPQAFMDLHHLDTLNLARNKLTTLKQNDLRGLDALKNLYLNENMLSTIATDLFSFVSDTLLMVDLSQNVITTVAPDAFRDLYELDLLHLQHNRLKTLSPRTFTDLEGVRRIDLNTNEIGDVPPNIFASCHQLQFIELSYNNISVLHNESFVGPVNIQLLDIHSNSLKTFPPQTFRRANVEKLHLDRNPIVILQGEIFPPTLRLVTIRNMPTLRTIGDGVFWNLPFLKTVTINNNRYLNSVDMHAFSNSTGNLDLDLSSNALTSLDSYVVNLESIHTVALGDNPWDCTCHLLWMKNMPNSTYGFQTVRCHTPRKVKHRLLVDVSAGDLRCSGSTSKRGIAYTLLIVIGVMGIFGLVLIIFKKRKRCMPTFVTMVTKPSGYDVMYNTLEDGDVTPAVCILNEKRKLYGGEPPPTAV